MYVDTSRSNGGKHKIAKNRKCLMTHACKKIVHAFVTFRLDYGYAMLLGVNVRLTQKLQIMQNSAARLITRQRRCDHQHITPSLIALHYLPVRWRINYKTLMLTYRAVYDLAPACIIDIVEFLQAPISAPFPIPISLRVLRHRFECLHDRGRVKI